MAIRRDHDGEFFRWCEGPAIGTWIGWQQLQRYLEEQQLIHSKGRVKHSAFLIHFVGDKLPADLGTKVPLCRFAERGLAFDRKQAILLVRQPHPQGVGIEARYYMDQ